MSKERSVEEMFDVEILLDDVHGAFRLQLIVKPQCGLREVLRLSDNGPFRGRPSTASQLSPHRMCPRSHRARARETHFVVNAFRKNRSESVSKFC